MTDTARLLKFRSPIHRNTRPRNPSRLVGRKEHDHIGYVFRLADSFQRLHSKRHLPTCLALREIRHIGVDHAGKAELRDSRIALNTYNLRSCSHADVAQATRLITQRLRCNG
jgi:hypothetical protein